MVNSKIISNGIVRAALTLLAIAAVLYLLFLIRTVLIYIVVALILTLIGNPIAKWLRVKLKFPNVLAVSVTLLLYVGIIAGFIMMFIPLIIAQGESLSVLKISTIQHSITVLTEQVNAWLSNYQLDTQELIKESNISLQFIPNFLNGLLGTLGSFGMGLASVLFITFFFLKDRRMFTVGFKRVLPEEHEDKILNSLDKIDDLLSRYFLGLLLQLFIVFVMYLIVLLIFGIKSAFVIAFLCAVLNIIPYIGPLIASVLAGLLTMISHIGGDFQSEILPQTIYVLIGFWLVQVVDNNLSQPLIFSKSTDSHPLEIFLVILIAGFLSGVMGMIAAVPLYTMLKVVAKEFFPDYKVIRMLTKNI